ncbi:hypothetical protein D3C71_1142500 [compost metagenome]
MSWAMIRLTGAARVLARLPSAMCVDRRALASGEVTKTKRAGVMLTAVGPNLVRS